MARRRCSRRKTEYADLHFRFSQLASFHRLLVLLWATALALDPVSNAHAFLEAMKAEVQEALESAGPASRLGEQES